MIKIYKNALKTLLLLVLILSTDSSALAAQLTMDEQESVKLIEQREYVFSSFETEVKNAIFRLKGLGIMKGYPDGTFGEDETITRAEFTKLAVITAGLNETALNEQGNPSVFTDVDPGFWANGWITVAVRQQFIKGDGDGKFRPNDTITQGEAVTVLLRILGYNDNLPGMWPSNYIAKAAQIGILDKITFLANSPITRAEIAVITSGVLDQVMVEYNATSNCFEIILQKESDIIPNGNTQEEVPYKLLYVFKRGE